jgi:Ca2+ transporting ATPase
MSTIFQRNDKSLVMFTKGAPDFLLSLCSHYISETGEPQPIDEYFTSTMQAVIDKFAADSLRTLLLCYKHIDPSDLKGNLDDLEHKLTAIAVVGIKDPLRPEIPEAVRLCKRAGIIVRMVTGDNMDTAIAIAKEAEILPSNYVKPAADSDNDRGKYIVLDGKTFRTLVEGLTKGEGEDKDKEFVKNLEIFKTIAKELRVLARSSP